MPKKSSRYLALLGFVTALVIGTAAAYDLRSMPTEGEDIYYTYVEGQRILNGENPYARVLEGDMRKNDKYANFFALSYEVSALSPLAGLHEYPAWITFWRVVLSAFCLAVGAAMFWVLYRRQLYVAAVFAIFLWFFNRWTSNVLEKAEPEFISLFLVILSLELFKKHRWTSLLLFSTSLAVKHIAVFMVPVYLIWAWQESPDLLLQHPTEEDLRQRDFVKRTFGIRSRLKQAAVAALVIASVPLIASAPFLVWNAEALVKSIAFETTRYPEGYRAIDRMFGWGGLLLRLPLLVVLALAWLLAWRRRGSPYTSALLVQATVVGVNPAFFGSYVTWFFPFVPLVLCDFSDATRANSVPPESSEVTKPEVH